MQKRIDILVQYISTRFKKEDELVWKDRRSGGVLVWSHSAITFSEMLKSKNTNGCRREMTGYLFECIYVLLISPTDNVSKNLGFEGVGLFDTRN